MTTYTNFSEATITRIIEGATEVTPKRAIDGLQWVVFYPSGYGFSAVKHMGSYGGSLDLWELAVIREDSTGWDIVYDSPITNDVLGFLSEDEVAAVAEEIRSLQ